MKILQVATSYQSIATILFGKLSYLGRFPELELHVASSSPDQSEKRMGSWIFHRVEIPREIRLVRDAKAVVDIARYARENRMDIIHTHTAKAGVVGAVAGLFAGIPVVHTYHGLPFYRGQRGPAYLAYWLIELVCSLLRSRIFSQNQHDLTILSRNPLVSRKAHYEGNGVDITEIQESASANLAGVPFFADSSRVHILCVSRLEPVKRLDSVIAAIGFLKQNSTAVDCVIAGKGFLQSALKAGIASLGLSTDIAVGYTPFIHSLIQKADIVVLASEKEGIPRGIMEAMALGKPVVATDVPGTNELVVDEKTGYLVPLGDQASLNKRLEELVLNPGLRGRMGAEGRERVRTMFSEKKIVDLWVKTYEEILGRKRE